MKYEYTHKRSKSRLVLKALTSIAVVLFIGLLGYGIAYPYISDIQLKRDNLNTHDIVYRTTVNLLTTISEPVEAEESYFQGFDSNITLEHLSREAQAQQSNEGSIKESLESRNTRIELKSAGVDTQIVDGEDAFAMERGPWHFPLSTVPGEDGNFVVIGHRFAELPPSTNTFFNLDKAKVGDKIEVTQEGGVQYTYTVIETKVIEKTDRSVLNKSRDQKITLITCTPLWESSHRLVVIGQLDKAYRNI